MPSVWRQCSLFSVLLQGLLSGLLFFLSFVSQHPTQNSQASSLFSIMLPDTLKVKTEVAMRPCRSRPTHSPYRLLTHPFFLLPPLIPLQSYVVVVVVQSLCCVQLFGTLWTAACQASLSFTISYSLLKLMSVESMMPSNHLLLCHSLLLLPLIFPSIRVFPNEWALCIRWPKYWTFSFSISPTNEYSGLIFFRIDWFDLLEVQGTLKSLQHRSSKASILQHSAFFMVHLSHPYVTTEKNHSFDQTDLCRQSNVSAF